MYAGGDQRLGFDAHRCCVGETHRRDFWANQSGSRWSVWPPRVCGAVGSAVFAVQLSMVTAMSTWTCVYAGSDRRDSTATNRFGDVDDGNQAAVCVTLAAVRQTFSQ